jgi:hypothetical protein
MQQRIHKKIIITHGFYKKIALIPPKIANKTLTSGIDLKA